MAYEIGAKTQWLKDTLQLNGAVFYQDYQNFQLNTFGGLEFVVSSIPQVTSKGIELDTRWLTPIQQLSLQGALPTPRPRSRISVPPGSVCSARAGE